MTAELDEWQDWNARHEANLPRAAVSLNGRGAPRGLVEGGRDALWTDAGEWSEAAIPPRPWVVPGVAMRGAVSVVAGPGSAGKSSLMCTWAVAAALGEECGGFKPVGPLRVLTYNVEDDNDEQKRRFSAALRPFGRGSAALRGKVIRCGPTGLGTLLERDPVTGAMVMTPAWAALCKRIADEKPDLVILDPLVELHSLDENDNTALRLVVAHLRELAQHYNCAVVLIHHVRKGAVAGDVDAVRGAGALVGAARSVFTVTPMSEEEAKQLGVPEHLRKLHIRVDSVKGNYAPPERAAWHTLEEHELDNGERVAATVPWTPPQPSAAGVAPEVVALVGAAIERGCEGEPWSPRLSLEHPRSLAVLLARHGVTAPAAQKAMLRDLLATGGFQTADFRDRNRMKRVGLRSTAGMPRARWLDGAGAGTGGEQGSFGDA